MWSESDLVITAITAIILLSALQPKGDIRLID